MMSPLKWGNVNLGNFTLLLGGAQCSMCCSSNGCSSRGGTLAIPYLCRIRII